MQVNTQTALKGTVLFFVILTLFVVVNCGGGRGESNTEPPLSEFVTVKVFCGRGVQGTPQGVYSSQERNSIFGYDFSLLSTEGYKNLQVRIDGDLVPSYGNMVVSNDITIIATAIPMDERPRFKTNTHTHTTNSDGSFSPEQIVSQYQSLQYDVLFLTDHNKVTLADYLEGILVIPGEELTSFKHHANALFATETIDPGNQQPSDYLQYVIKSGALPMLNHPVWPLADWKLSDIPQLTGLSLIEIYNASTELQGFHDDLKLWDSLLSSGKLWYGVASDDAHKQSEIGRGWIIVQADELDSASIRKGIEDGDFYASTGVELCRLDITDGIIYIESRNGNVVEFIGNNGTLLKRTEGPFGYYQVQTTDVYVRVVVTGKNNAKAWTQPLFWRPAPS